MNMKSLVEQRLEWKKKKEELAAKEKERLALEATKKEKRMENRQKYLNTFLGSRSALD